MPGLFRQPSQPQQRRKLSAPAASAVVSVYQNAVVARSPVGYWRLGDTSGTTAVAVVGPNGTYEGSPTQNVTGLIDDADTAVTFDGSNDSVNIGDQTWTDDTAKWTVTAWVNSTADATYRRLWSKEDDSNFGVHLYWQNSEYGVVRRNTTDVIEAKVTSGAPTGTHFVAASYSAVDDKLHLYLDGVQVAESTATTSGNFNHTHPFRISGAESTLVNVINGTIDEVAVFDYALDATAIEGLYNVGANGDQSPQYSDAVEDLSPTAYWRLDDTDSTMLATVGPNGTYVNTPTLGATGALGGDLDTAATFVSASSEYATVTDTAALDLGNTFSIVAWVKRTTAVDVTTILSKGADAYLLQFEFGNHLVLTQAGVAHSVSSAAVITDTRWHFVVATHTGTAGKLYIDGVEDSVPESATTFTDNTNALEIARANGGGGYLNATLDEIALFNYVLTPGEITDLYRLGVGAEALDLGAAEDLIAYVGGGYYG